MGDLNDTQGGRGLFSFFLFPFFLLKEYTISSLIHLTTATLTLTCLLSWHSPSQLTPPLLSTTSTHDSLCRNNNHFETHWVWWVWFFNTMHCALLSCMEVDFFLMSYIMVLWYYRSWFHVGFNLLSSYIMG